MNPSIKKQKLLTPVNMCLVAIFTALIALAGTVLKIPLPPPMPSITTQFFFCAMAGVLLGSKLGALSVLLYVLLGLVGLPIFTTGGGIGYIFMPTFGYLIGFIFCAFLAGVVREKAEASKKGLRLYHLFLGSFSGLLASYAFGVMHMYLIKNFHIHDAMDLFTAIQVGMLVFVVQDTLWCVVISVVGKRFLSAIRTLDRRFQISR